MIGPSYLGPMDDLRLGRVIRAVRRRRGLRQLDVARLANVGQTTVSLVERGHLATLGLRTVRRVCSTLEVRLELEPSWRGGQLARLLDSRHASIVEEVVAALGSRGWEAVVEYTFAVYGERGSVDVLAWHSRCRALLLVEVKTEIADLQGLLSVLDRKARLVPGLVAAERGWRATTLGVVLVLGEGGSTRGALARHRATFAASLPGRTIEVRRWIQEPAPGGLRGVWILRGSSGRAANQTRGGPDRVRMPRGRAPAPAEALERQDRPVLRSR